MTKVFAARDGDGVLDVFGSEESAEKFAGENGEVTVTNVELSPSHYFQRYHYTKKGGFTLEIDEEGNRWNVNVQPGRNNDIIDRLENGESYDEVFSNE